MKRNADQIDLFADFNGLPNDAAKTEFYQHDAHWANHDLGRQPASHGSLAERGRMRGKVQCIYFDPPYGIKFNSNFNGPPPAATSRTATLEHITREPEQVKAFRDTWRDGIHSYLTYLRDRLTVARDLLTESGRSSCRLERVSQVKALMDEYWENNFVRNRLRKQVVSDSTLESRSDYIVWYAKQKSLVQVSPLYSEDGDEGASTTIPIQLPNRAFRINNSGDGVTSFVRLHIPADVTRRNSIRVF